jgi:hypothetical protein
MEMFLMALVLSVLGAGVSALAFAAATRGADEAPAAQPQPQPAPRPALAAARFFADEQEVAPHELDVVRVVLQIERHIRLEQAAAEAFLSQPTAESLHSRTASPLSN